MRYPTWQHQGVELTLSAECTDGLPDFSVFHDEGEWWYAGLDLRVQGPYSSREAAMEAAEHGVSKESS